MGYVRGDIEAERPLSPGMVLGEKYRIDRLLGEGAMGMVFAATHVVLGETVAVKVLHPSIAEQDAARERFANEARIAARLKSDHIARVSDVGQLEGGGPFIVMEYLDGQDLAEILLLHRRIHYRQAASWLLQACDALEEAHRAGVVHRDLKPENIFLANRPDGSKRIKVLDFGVSKVVESTNPRLSRPRALTTGVIGTPAYMAPEQMSRNGEVGPHTDVWALGVILYELVAGRHPFEGDNLTEVCAQILNGDPAPLSSLVPSAPAALDAMLRDTLRKNWRERTKRVADLRTALLSMLETPEPSRAFVDAQTTADADLVLPPSVDLARTSSANGDDWTSRRLGFASTAVPAPSRRGRLAAGALLGVCALAGTSYFAGSATSDSASTTTSPESAVHPAAASAHTTHAALVAPEVSPAASATAGPAPPSPKAVGKTKPRVLPSPAPQASSKAPPAAAPSKPPKSLVGDGLFEDRF